MKRILSIIIALACCLVLPVSALAADEAIDAAGEDIIELWEAV